MSSYIEMRCDNTLVRVEVDDSGSSGSRGGELSSLFETIAGMVGAIAQKMSQLDSSPHAEIQFGVRAGTAPTIVLDQTKANFLVRVVCEASVGKLLGDVPKAPPR